MSEKFDQPNESTLSTEQVSDASDSASKEVSPKGIEAIKGDQASPAEGTSEWVDHGIIDVSVQDLPMPDGVNGPEDFDHHISWEDAEAATEKLPEIQKAVAEGKGADDFSGDDRRIYDLYYGSDPVYLNKDGQNYDIVSGRHRIYAAKHLGLSTLPAHVKEKVVHE